MCKKSEEEKSREIQILVDNIRGFEKRMKYDEDKLLEICKNFTNLVGEN